MHSSGFHKTLTIGINDDYPLTDLNVVRWQVTRADGGAVKTGKTLLAEEAVRRGLEELRTALGW